MHRHPADRKTPVPVGVPKTGFMIESMVTATAQNIASLIDGKPPTAGDLERRMPRRFRRQRRRLRGAAQIPPRNVNWSSPGKWVHTAKVGFEKYFLHKMRKGATEPFYEKFALRLMGVEKLASAPPPQ